MGVAKVNYGTYLKQPVSRRRARGDRRRMSRPAPPARHRRAGGCPGGRPSRGPRRRARTHRSGSAAAGRPSNLRPAGLACSRKQRLCRGVEMDVVMRMPDLATVDDTVTLLRWLVEVGQPIRRGEPLLEVETDKAILVVESVGVGDAARDRGPTPVPRWPPARSSRRSTSRKGPRPDRRRLRPPARSRPPMTQSARSRARPESPRGPPTWRPPSDRPETATAVGGRSSPATARRGPRRRRATRGPIRGPTTARSCWTSTSGWS